MPQLPTPLSATAVPPVLPCILALDTSTEQLAVALCARGQAWHAQAEGGAQASARLLPLVHGLLHEAGVPMQDVRFIAFGRGPGAFTGLRTSCAVAQGLGLGLGVPLLPIDSLLIVAEDARIQAAQFHEGAVVGVAMDARMGEAYAGVFRWHGGAWQVLQPAALHNLAGLAQAWEGVPMHAVAGSGLLAFDERLACPVDAVRLEREHDRAAALLRLALAAAQAGQGVDAADALPLYLRDKVALTTDERAAARAAAVAPT